MREPGIQVRTLGSRNPAGDHYEACISTFCEVSAWFSTSSLLCVCSLSLFSDPVASTFAFIVLNPPRGTGWRGRWGGGSGWGTHVNPWLIHFNV